MENEHVILADLINSINAALAKNEQWMVYNTAPHSLEKEGVYFFSTEDEAEEFSMNNISDYDKFRIITISSVEDAIQQIQYDNLHDYYLSSNRGLSVKKFTSEDIANNKAKDLDNLQQLSNKNLITNKTFFMNEKNYEYLKDNIKYMGFGEKQQDTLEKNLAEGKESFQMTFNTEVNKKPFEAVLQFRKSDNADMYFLNSYHASLERTNGEKMEQTFYLNKGKGVTAKEAYNLLEGRAVFKELNNKAGEPYKAWIQLDFDNKEKNNNHEVKQYHENYGYDLKAAVGKYPVAEMDGHEKEKSLLQSLQKGNVQSVNMERDGTSHKMFVEANPQYKTVTLYDDHMKRVQKENLEQYIKKDQSPNKEVKQDISEDKKKSTKQKLDDSLSLPKKNTSRKKGMSV